jgi:hypothetical protein
MKQIIGIVTIAVIYIAVFWLLPLRGAYKRGDIKVSLTALLIMHATIAGVIGLSLLICWCFGLI